MSFFVEPAKGYIPQPGETLNAITDPKNVIRSDPSAVNFFDAIKEVRQIQGEAKGKDWKWVATMKMPYIKLAEIMEGGQFIKDKRKFFRWLDSGNNMAYCTYDRRRIPAKRSDMVTFVGGQEV